MSGGTAVADGPAKNRRVGLTGRVDGGLVQGGGGGTYLCTPVLETPPQYVCSVDKILAAGTVFKIIPQIFQNVRQQWEPLLIPFKLTTVLISFVFNSCLIKCLEFSLNLLKSTRDSGSGNTDSHGPLELKTSWTKKFLVLLVENRLNGLHRRDICIF